MEEYRIIEGYEVSNLGNSKQKFNVHQNYLRSTDGNDKLLHILVAKAFPEFCGEWFEGCVVHHKDRNTLNNNVNNLAVISRGEHFKEHHLENTIKRKEKYKNNEPWYKIASIKKERGTEHNTNKWCNIAKCDLQDNVIEVYSNVYEASIKNNLSATPIRRCLQGINKTSGGYKWKKL